MSISGPVSATQIKYVGSLNGRFLLPDRRQSVQGGQAAACRMQSVSVSELVFEAEIKAAPGEHFEGIFEELGPLRGKVVRAVRQGFVVGLELDEEQQQALPRTIEWLKKRHVRQATNKRSSPRFGVRGEQCLLYAGDLEIDCRLADVSTEGAMVVTNAATVFDLGAIVEIGRVTAKVVRRQPDRLGVEFTTPHPLKTLLVELKSRRATPQDTAPRQISEAG